MERFLSVHSVPRGTDGLGLLTNPAYYEHLTDKAHPKKGPRKPPTAEISEMDAAGAYDTGVRWGDHGL